MNQYFFQELCTQVQDEIIQLARLKFPRQRWDSPEVMESIDDYINCHNFRQTVPDWFQAIGRPR